MSQAQDKFVADLVSRLSEDIIQYCEVRSVTLYLYPNLDDEQRMRRIVEAISYLLDHRLAVIGETAVINGIIHVVPWPEEGAALKERLNAVVHQWPRPTLGDGFWLSRPHPPQV